MICPSRTPNQVIALSRHIATQLVTAAADPEMDFTTAERRWLAGLSVAIEAEAARVVQAEADPPPAESPAPIEAAGN